MAKTKFYAVRKGKRTGIFTSWTECEAFVKGFEGAEFKSFPTEEDCKKYLAGEEENPTGKAKKARKKKVWNIIWKKAEAILILLLCPTTR